MKEFKGTKGGGEKLGDKKGRKSEKGRKRKQKTGEIALNGRG